MRLSVITNVSVLLLCSSLAYWAGLKQAGGVEAGPAAQAEQSRRSTRAKKTQAPEVVPEKRSVTQLVEEIQKATSGKQSLSSTDAWDELVERDPEKAWELLIQSGDRKEFFNQSDSILFNLAEKDPRRAHELVLQLKNSAQRTASLATVLNVWGVKEPKEALTAALNHPESRRPSLVFELAQQWGGCSVTEAAAFAAAMPQGALRRGFHEGLASTWMASDVEGFCAWFKGLSPRDSHSLMGKLSMNFDSDEPKGIGSLKMIWDTLPPGQKRESFVSSLVMPLALESGEDFAKHMAEIEALPDSKLSQLLRDRLLDRYAEEEPALAATFLAQTNLGEKARFTLLPAVARSWAMTDPEAAKAWVEALPPGELRDQALGCLIQGISQDNAEHALALFLSHPELANETGPSGALSALVDSDLDPAELLKAIPLVKDVERQNEVLNNLSHRWAAEDLHGCVEWIETLPAGASRDRAVEGLIEVISSEDGKTAVEWAMTMQDPEMRQERIQFSLAEWSQRAPDSAEAWLEANKTQLPKDMQAFVRNMIKHARSGNSANGLEVIEPETEQR